ncbi:1,3-beta-glucanosyltransferase gel1 [Sclerotinia borealis F-4128]|uniref:1,3-beta-glucanosyltransferase n=1 Tax=Sclerotinia borealis (strain F-4128) TaxID=1432307 RepID=W9CQH6_SCLBF|nr:1,3-beta-glucanosyltransferase gel1 [Sclerotinia borealis F-4128]
MKTFNTIAALAVAGSALAAPSPVENLAPRASSTSLTAITTKGNAFFSGDSRFYIRGVDYQPGGSSKLVDPIADKATCTRDIAKFKDLGINTVRVYSVDNSANHDDCMSALAAAGIYLVLDVNTPLYSLNRATPGVSYNSDYLQNIFATIDAFANYTNTLAFFSGNEVINDDTTTNAAPYVKAVTRDMRQYIGSRGYRSIPVGYSAADVDSNRLEMAQYMNCGTDDQRSDFFAFNDYSWCDPSSFTVSGWDQKVKNFTDYGLPIFLSEYGCNTNTRAFEEVKSLYSTDMTAVYSGGLVYEYSEEGSKYGLVTIKGDSVTEKDDFSALKSAFAGTANPSGDGGYSSTNKASDCPSQSTTWNVTSDDLPAIPSGAAALMKSGAGAGVGLTGAGSQNSGGTSTGTATAGSGSVTAVATGSGTGTGTSKPSAGNALAPMEKSSMVIGVLLASLTFVGAALL